MPPKKRKAAEKKGSDAASSFPYVWVLTYQSDLVGDDGPKTRLAVFSSKEKAIAGLSDFMDKHGSMLSEDWKNGLPGFGREDEDDYMGFEYCGATVGDEGALLHNRTSAENAGDCLTEVCIQRVKLDDAKG